MAFGRPHSGLKEAADTALLRLLSGGEAAEGELYVERTSAAGLGVKDGGMQRLGTPQCIAVESGLDILSPTTEFPYVAGGVLEERESLRSNSSPHDFKLSFDSSKAGYLTLFEAVDIEGPEAHFQPPNVRLKRL
ncbi:hypothetical protein K438DRAFT_1982415 [Mycena galopus ATCC 62051]|nr:hypothetical protein K438DRAFT_1982415 [Mycena galopus ATCC 62051]